MNNPIREIGQNVNIVQPMGFLPHVLHCQIGNGPSFFAVSEQFLNIMGLRRGPAGGGVAATPPNNGFRRIHHQVYHMLNNAPAWMHNFPVVPCYTFGNINLNDLHNSANNAGEDLAQQNLNAANSTGQSNTNTNNMPHTNPRYHVHVIRSCDFPQASTVTMPPRQNMNAGQGHSQMTTNAQQNNSGAANSPSNIARNVQGQPNPNGGQRSGTNPNAVVLGNGTLGNLNNAHTREIYQETTITLRNYYRGIGAPPAGFLIPAQLQRALNGLPLPPFQTCGAIGNGGSFVTVRTETISMEPAAKRMRTDLAQNVAGPAMSASNLRQNGGLPPNNFVHAPQNSTPIFFSGSNTPPRITDFINLSARLTGNWTIKERWNFHLALRRHGLNFELIARTLPRHDTNDCIAYYYENYLMGRMIQRNRFNQTATQASPNNPNQN